MKKSTIVILCLMGGISMLNGQRLEMGKDIIITQAVGENLYTTGDAL